MGRRYYIPRTRSGSSMLASVLTQALDANRRERNYKLTQQLANNEISPWSYFFQKHPLICIWIASLVVGIIYGMLSSVFGR